MNLRGRPPKPTALKLLEGNPGKRPLPKDEPQPAELTSLEPTAFLDEAGRNFWTSYAPEVARLGLLTVLDIPLFEAACQQHSVYVRATLRLGNRLAGKVSKELRKTAKDALDERNRILGLFGFSPVARAKLGITDAHAPEDPAESFLSKKPRREA